jgi:hypothetical protein
MLFELSLLDFANTFGISKFWQNVTRIQYARVPFTASECTECKKPATAVSFAKHCSTSRKFIIIIRYDHSPQESPLVRMGSCRGGRNLHSSEKCGCHISRAITCDHIHNVKKTQRGLIRVDSNDNNCFDGRSGMINWKAGIIICDDLVKEWWQFGINIYSTCHDGVSVSKELVATRDQPT